MKQTDLTTKIRQRAKEASHVEVVGDRVFTARLACTLGLLLGLSVHYSQEMGKLMAQPLPPLPELTVIQKAEMMPQEIPPPDAPYRVEVMDLTDGKMITSVHLGADWTVSAQRSLLRKLVIQADQRGVTQDRALSVHAYAVDGKTQEQAMAFLGQAIAESGIATTTMDMATDGSLKTSGRPAGLRFDYDSSAQSLDRLGSDPCFVKTGDAIGCMRADRQGVPYESLGRKFVEGATERPPSRAPSRHSRLR